MIMPVSVKICGLSDRAGLDAAVAAGARYVGFVFFAKSPRAVTVEQAAELAVEVPPGIAKVALVVDADDAVLDEIVARVAGSSCTEFMRTDVFAPLGLTRIASGPVNSAARLPSGPDLGVACRCTTTSVPLPNPLAVPQCLGQSGTEISSTSTRRSSISVRRSSLMGVCSVAICMKYARYFDQSIPFIRCVPLRELYVGRGRSQPIAEFLVCQCRQV